MNRILSFILIFASMSLASLMAQTDIPIRIISSFESSCLLTEYNKSDSVLLGTDSVSYYTVCRGSSVTYTASSPAATHFQWFVDGGEVTSASADSTTIEVAWGEVDRGTVWVRGWNGRGAKGECTYCVRVVDPPHSHFSTVPPYYIDALGLKIIEICQDQEISLIDQSTTPSSTITGVLWDTPYGAFSSSSASFTPNASGRYVIRHRVQNECGCTDEDSLVVQVSGQSTLELSCYGTVCAGTTAKYRVLSPYCEDYRWMVDGGVIVSGQNTSSVTVQWENPASGYGTLSIDGSLCAMACNAYISKKIPVIGQNVPIAGADTLCVGETKVFELPLWGSTDYHWSISPETGYVQNGYEYPNQQMVRFDKPGTYILSAEYTCSFIGCGPLESAPKTIVVKDTLSIHALADGCVGDPVSISTNSASGNTLWTIFKPDGSVILDTVSSSLTHTFLSEGRYIIVANHSDYCRPARHLINIHAAPPPPQIDGTMACASCENSSVVLGATPTSRDYYLTWVPTCDTTQVKEGDTVTVDFHEDICPVMAFQVDRQFGCSSTPCTVRVDPFRLSDIRQRRYTVGPECSFTVSTNDPVGLVTYRWTLSDNQYCVIAGSTVSPSVEIVGRYFPGASGNAELYLERTYCDTLVQIDTLGITVHNDLGGINIDIPDSVCQYHNVLFTWTPSSYSVKTIWHFHQTSPTIQIPIDSYESNTPFYKAFSEAGWHRFDVTVINLRGCDTLTFYDSLYVSPKPQISITFDGSTLYVPEQNNVTYRWYKDGVFVGSGASCHASSMDGYCCVATSTVGLHCSDSACTGILPSSSICERLCVVQDDSSCDTVWLRITDQGVNLSHLLTNTIEWSVTNMSGNSHNPVSFIHTRDPYKIKMVATSPGVYYVEAHAEGADHPYYCYSGGVYVTIAWVPKFSVKFNCEDSTITVFDQSEYLPGTPRPSRAVCNYSIRLNTAIFGDLSSGVRVMYPIPDGTDAVRIPARTDYTNQIRFQLGLNGDTCVAKKYIHVPAYPKIDSLYYQHNICDQISLHLGMKATGGRSYRWDFGNGSYATGAETDYLPIYQTGTTLENSHTLTATVFNELGCRADSAFSVTVSANPFSKLHLDLDDTTAVCPGVQKTLICDKDLDWATYTWTNSFSTDTLISQSHRFAVFQTGNYRVRATDENGCIGEAMANVRYLTAPVAFITGDTLFCQGDAVELLGFSGRLNSYSWFVTDSSGDTVYSSSAANISFHPDTSGHFTAHLFVSSGDSCPAYSSHSFVVLPQPGAPSIAFGNPCANTPPVQLRSSSGRSLYWSNGIFSDTADFFTDGYATAHYYDSITGCMSREAKVFIHPQPNFDAVLTGCYAMCDRDFSAELPVYGFYPFESGLLSWVWEKDGGTVQNGNSRAMSLTIPYYGSYQLRTRFGLGCASDSPFLDITTTSRCTCDSIQISAKNTCEAKDCTLQITATATICSLGSSTIFDSIRSPVGDNVVSISPWPISVPADSCVEVTIVFQRSSHESEYATWVLRDSENGCTKEFGIPYSADDCMAGDCLMNVNYFNPLVELSTAAQTSVIDFSFDFGSDIISVFNIWGDYGQVVDHSANGSNVSGTLCLGFGQIAQLAMSGDSICIHVVVCTGEKYLCHAAYCFSAEDLYRMCYPEEKGLQQGHPDIPIRNRSHSVSLVPNPATDIVQISGIEVADEVKVFDMQGRLWGDYSQCKSFSASQLPTGSFIVKIVAQDGTVDFVKLIKK